MQLINPYHSINNKEKKKQKSLHRSLIFGLIVFRKRQIRHSEM